MSCDFWTTPIRMEITKGMKTVYDLLSDFRKVIGHWTNVFVRFAYSLYFESRLVQKLILRYFQSSDKFLDNRKSIVKSEGGWVLCSLKNRWTASSKLDSSPK